MNDNTLFLAERPSFLEGLGRVFDFAGAMNQYNSSPSGEEADAIAMEADWAAVGDDLSLALSKFEQGPQGGK